MARGIVQIQRVFVIGVVRVIHALLVDLVDARLAVAQLVVGVRDVVYNLSVLVSNGARAPGAIRISLSTLVISHDLLKTLSN